MKPAIVAADIRSALESIESNAFGARGEGEEFELEARMFRILCDVRDIRQMLTDIDKPASDVTEMASALASKSRGT
jgi:hypothetical protein